MIKTNNLSKKSGAVPSNGTLHANEDRVLEDNNIMSDGSTSFKTRRGYVVQIWKNKKDELVGALKLPTGTLAADFHCAFCPNPNH